LEVHTVAASIVAHVQWAKWSRSDGVTEHVFRTHQLGIWYRDITLAGWMHVFVMAALLAIVLLYAISPLPIRVVITVSILLTVHVLIGTMQPGWYCTGKLWTWKNFGPPLLSAVLILTIAVLKTQLQKSSL
jgi:hypothetical protein